MGQDPRANRKGECGCKLEAACRCSHRLAQLQMPNRLLIEVEDVLVQVLSPNLRLYFAIGRLDKGYAPLRATS